MEFVSENKGFHRNEDEEEEEEEDEGEEVIGHARSFTFSSSSSPYDASKPYQKLYCGTNFDEHSEEDAIRSHHRAHQEPEIRGGQEAFPNFNRKLELIDLTLRSSSTDESADGVGSSRDIGSSGGGDGAMEREHMFDKVVTPSDVGKLNRLVIPKQHAEKYFPLNSSANEKDLLLNFEDRNGKPWRFRYSYWNSSQSYVMTKGWSRFVKEKKLGAGDIVSFQRGVGESGRDRLYIDFRHRPEAHDHQSLLSPLPSVPWGRLYSVPPPMSVAMSMLRGHHDQHLQQPTYNIAQPFPFHHHRAAGHSRDIHEFRPANLGPPSIYCFRPSVPHQIGAVRFGYVGPNSEQRSPAATSKRLRLFGVNMECPMPDDSDGGVPDVAFSLHCPSSSFRPPN